MRRITYSVLTVLASLALVSPLQASTVFSEQAEGTTFYQNPALESGNTDEISKQNRIGLTDRESAHQILGIPVIAQDGDNIGEVRDLKIDTSTGRIDYVVLEKEAAFGGETSFIPVPLGALTFTGQEARLTVDKNKLENVPNPELMSDREFQRDLHSHYGVAPVWEGERQ